METRLPGPGRRPARYRFNSATAVMPWKQQHRAGPVPAEPGFNSATAVMPWKHAAPGPRPRQRSERRHPPGQTLPAADEKGSGGPRGRLQFGHGCDAVETAVAPKPAIDPNGLQFGHGCDAVETRDVTCGSPHGRYGLQFGHGCDAVETSLFEDTWYQWTKLQFGHGCDAVETNRSVRWEVALGQLQFGHGCDAVETLIFDTLHPELFKASIRPRL